MKLGSWTDHGSIGVESNPSMPYNAIDANIFDEHGRLHMTFGSYWHNIFQVEMNNKGTKATSSPKQIAYEPAGNHKMEGAYLYMHNKDYYLFYSVGFAGHYDDKLPPKGQEYRIKVCRSSSPNGGFVSAPLLSCDATDINPGRTSRKALH